jgi:Type IX secretion system protein PorV
MKMRIHFFLVTLLISGICSAGNFSSSSKGTTAAGFLKLGVGARAVAMGEAYSAVADDATALYWNPAALRQVEKNSISLMHAAYLESSNFDYGAFVHSGEKSSFGVGVQYMTAGNLTGRDDTGVETGGFEPTDLAISLGYARNIGGGAIGLSAKFIQSKIIDSSETGAIDVGILTPRFFNEKVRFGLTAANIGGTLKYAEKSESLPMIFKIGSGLQATKNWIIGADLGFPRDNEAYGAIGTEYLIRVANDVSIAPRAGFNTRTTSDVDGFTGASFGAGFNLKKISFDYGFVPFGDIGSTHRISVSFKF